MEREKIDKIINVFILKQNNLAARIDVAARCIINNYFHVLREDQIDNLIKDLKEYSKENYIDNDTKKIIYDFIEEIEAKRIEDILLENDT